MAIFHQYGAMCGALLLSAGYAAEQYGHLVGPDINQVKPDFV